MGKKMKAFHASIAKVILALLFFCMIGTVAYAEQAYWADSTNTKLTQLTVSAGKETLIRLIGQVPSGKTLNAYQFHLTYDPAKISISNVVSSTVAGKPSPFIGAILPSTYPSSSGAIDVNAFSVSGLTGPASVPIIDVTVKGTNNTNGAFTFNINVVNFGSGPDDEFLPDPVPLSTTVAVTPNEIYWADTSDVRLTTLSSLMPGAVQTIRVRADVSAGSPVKAFKFIIPYDSNMISIDNVQFLAGFQGDYDTSKAGTLAVNGFNTSGASGSVSILAVTIRGVNAGYFRLPITVSAFGSSGTSSFIPETNDLLVKVGSEAMVYWADTSDVRITNPPNIMVGVQQTFKIKADLPTGSSAKVFKFMLTYDPKIISIVSVQSLAGFQGDYDTSQTGTILANGFNSTGVTGSVSLLSVTFQGLSVGYFDFPITVSALGSSGTSSFVAMPSDLVFKVGPEVKMYWADASDTPITTQRNLMVGAQQTMRVRMDLPSGKKLNVFKFVLNYDPTVISIANVQPLLSNFNVDYNNLSQTGTITANGFGTDGLTNSVSILAITMQGAAPGSFKFSITANTLGASSTDTFVATPSDISVMVSQTATTTTSTTTSMPSTTLGTTTTAPSTTLGTTTSTTRASTTTTVASTTTTTTIPPTVIIPSLNWPPDNQTAIPIVGLTLTISGYVQGKTVVVEIINFVTGAVVDTIRKQSDSISIADLTLDLNNTYSWRAAIVDTSDAVPVAWSTSRTFKTIVDSPAVKQVTASTPAVLSYTDNATGSTKQVAVSSSNATVTVSFDDVNDSLPIKGQVTSGTTAQVTLAGLPMPTTQSESLPAVIDINTGANLSQKGWAKILSDSTVVLTLPAKDSAACVSDTACTAAYLDNGQFVLDLKVENKPIVKTLAAPEDTSNVGGGGGCFITTVE